VGRHVRAQLVHRSQVWPLAGGWLEDHEVEGAPRVVKDITTTLSEQSENICVLQRTVVADAHGVAGYGPRLVCEWCNRVDGSPATMYRVKNELWHLFIIIYH
jgi:hypothetical protein